MASPHQIDVPSVNILGLIIIVFLPLVDVKFAHSLDWSPFMDMQISLTESE